MAQRNDILVVHIRLLVNVVYITGCWEGEQYSHGLFSKVLSGAQGGGGGGAAGNSLG